MVGPGRFRRVRHGSDVSDLKDRGGEQVGGSGADNKDLRALWREVKGIGGL